jgi:ATP-dependent exoDNAse (exonuclease V) beta subunit
LPAPADVKKDSERLRKLRTKAAERQERPLGGRASPTDRRPREMDEEPSRPSRDAASDRSSVGRRRSQAVGTAIHRLLEDLDLTGNPTRTDLVDRLQDARTRIPSLVASDLPPAEQEDARREAHREAEEVLDRIVGSRGEDLLDRLALIADNVVARELPILAPPDASGEEPGEKPVAFVSGSIDLVYRDPEKAELVVADYKANRVDDSGDVEAWIRDQRAHYTPQLRTYGRAIQQAFGLPSCPRTELWFLWLGRIVEVPGSD